jgi:peptidoglycan L-alanyl-D-glutamate endopeptidase CwlK
MKTYGATSKLNLSTSEKDLQTVMNEVIKDFDNTILYGYRTPEFQLSLFKHGRELIDGIWRIVDKDKIVTYCDGTIKKSNHNYSPSRAIDATPYPVNWKDYKRMYYFAGFVMAIAKRLKIEGKITHDLIWGGDWDGDTDVRDQTFMDDCHFELSILLLFNQCSPAKRLQNIYSHHPELAPKTSSTTIIKDSIRTEISYRDTTVYIPIPGETDHDTVTIPCPEPPKSYIPDTARAETSLAVAKAWWDWPHIELELVQKDTTIETRLKDAVRMKNVYRMLYEKTKSETITQVRYIPLIFKIALWAWLLVLTLFIGYIISRIYLKK